VAAELAIGHDASVADILIPAQSADDWQQFLAEPEKHLAHRPLR
jgi:hypothetical protein